MRRKKKRNIAYALGGDDLCAEPVALAFAPLGLPLPDRGSCAFGVADNGGRGWTAALCDEGDDWDVLAGAGGCADRSAPKLGLS